MLAVVVWPLSLYKPMQDAVADCYRKAAAFVTVAYELAVRPMSKVNGWKQAALPEQHAVGQALEAVRTGLATMRITRQGMIPCT